ncbi:MAG TPA: copper chaperone PCu(A)C [Alphaproteobacteria bacterium]
MRYLLLLVLSLLPLAAYAHDGVHAKNAYALETAADATVGAVFMDITALQATENDALLKAVTPIADVAEIHTVTTDDMGVAKMRALDKLPIPMKETTSLKQGGDHIMLKGLHAPLVAGTIFPLTLTFERGEIITVDVPVKAMNDPTIGVPAADAHHGH